MVGTTACTANSRFVYVHVQSVALDVARRPPRVSVIIWPYARLLVLCRTGMGFGLVPT